MTFSAEIASLIHPELLILIPALYACGAGLKRAARFADALIPATLAAIGVPLALLRVLADASLLGWQDVCATLFSGVVQGLLCAAAAVYAHQLAHQAKKG